MEGTRRRPSTRPGRVGPDDYFFLTACVSLLAPRRIIEVGTLTGFSAAIMAAALDRLPGQSENARVDSIDINTQCVVEPSRRTGFEVEEFEPSVAARVRFHNPHDSAHAASLVNGNELDFAFIDAGHRHPHPLLDLLRLARSMPGGSWIALHDIRLGTIGREAAARGESLAFDPVAGAEILLTRWPFPKVRGGNIGAVQLPPRSAALAVFGLRLMQEPFEVEERKRSTLRQYLYRAIGDLL